MFRYGNEQSISAIVAVTKRLQQFLIWIEICIQVRSRLFLAKTVWTQGLIQS